MVALGHAARDLEVDALVVERLPRDEVADDRLPLRVGVRIREADAVEAALQARQVMRQAERLAAVDGHELVHAVAVDEAAVEHRDVRVGERQELAVEVDDLVGVGHRDYLRGSCLA